MEVEGNLYKSDVMTGDNTVSLISTPGNLLQMYNHFVDALQQFGDAATTQFLSSDPRPISIASATFTQFMNMVMYYLPDWATLKGTVTSDEEVSSQMNGVAAMLRQRAPTLSAMFLNALKNYVANGNTVEYGSTVGTLAVAYSDVAKMSPALLPANADIPLVFGSIFEASTYPQLAFIREMELIGMAKRFLITLLCEPKIPLTTKTVTINLAYTSNKSLNSFLCPTSTLWMNGIFVATFGQGNLPISKNTVVKLGAAIAGDGSNPFVITSFDFTPMTNGAPGTTVSVDPSGGSPILSPAVGNPAGAAAYNNTNAFFFGEWDKMWNDWGWISSCSVGIWVVSLEPEMSSLPSDLDVIVNVIGRVQVEFEDLYPSANWQLTPIYNATSAGVEQVIGAMPPNNTNFAIKPPANVISAYYTVVMMDPDDKTKFTVITSPKQFYISKTIGAPGSGSLIGDFPVVIRGAQKMRFGVMITASASLWPISNPIIRFIGSTDVQPTAGAINKNHSFYFAGGGYTRVPAGMSLAAAYSADSNNKVATPFGNVTANMFQAISRADAPAMEWLMAATSKLANLTTPITSVDELIAFYGKSTNPAVLRVANVIVGSKATSALVGVPVPP